MSTNKAKIGTWIPALALVAACATTTAAPGAPDPGDAPGTAGETPAEPCEATRAVGDAEIDPSEAASSRCMIVMDQITVTGSGGQPTGPQGWDALRAFLERVKLEHERQLNAPVLPQKDTITKRNN